MDRKKILDRLQKSIARPAVGSVITDPAPAVAPADPPAKGPAPAPVDLLGQIEADLDRLRPTDSDDDGLSELVLALPATAGRVHLVSRRDRPYVLVPNAPRDLIVGWGYELAKIAGTVRAGASGTFVLPRADVVTIDYPAGTAGDMLYVYASARPIAAPGWAGNYVWSGEAWAAERTPTMFTPIPSTAIVAGVGITVWTPATGKRFRLMGWQLSYSATGTLIFADNAVGTQIYRTGSQNAGANVVSNIGNGILSAAVNNVLMLDATIAGNVSGTVWGTEE